MPEVQLPDGNQLSFDAPVAVIDVAKRISNGLAKAALDCSTLQRLD